MTTNGRRIKKGVLATGALALGFGAAPPGATASPAAPEAPGPEPEVRHVDVPTDAAKPATQITGPDRARVDRHLQNEARAGRLLDRSGLDLVSVDLGGGTTAGAIVDAQDRLEEVVRVDSSDDGEQGAFIGALFSDRRAGQATIDGGPGYDAAQGTNATRDSRSCRTLWFDATYSASHDHYVYDCWEKWKGNQSGWAYNRYTLFDPANADDFWERGELIDATIRTRPWRGDEGLVEGGPYDYDPHPSSSCSTGDARINVGPVGSISMPLVSCGGNLSVFPNGDAHSMGTDWNGRTTGQVRIDYAFEIATKNNAEPVYADYVWAEIQNCIDPVSCGGWNPSEYETWKDSGW